MFTCKQYDLFEQEQDEVSELRSDIEDFKKSFDNVRKGMFARHKKLEESDGVLLGLILKQQEELDQLRNMLIKVKK